MASVSYRNCEIHNEQSFSFLCLHIFLMTSNSGTFSSSARKDNNNSLLASARLMFRWEIRKLLHLRRHLYDIQLLAAIQFSWNFPCNVSRLWRARGINAIVWSIGAIIRLRFVKFYHIFITLDKLRNSALTKVFISKDVGLNLVHIWCRPI